MSIESDPADSAAEVGRLDSGTLTWFGQHTALHEARRRATELEQTVAKLRTQQSQLEEQPHCDCLTGLVNRQLLKDRFLRAQERAKRNGTSFALMMVHLDGLKAVTDNYGHAAGDAVLVAVAQRLGAVVRQCDTVARVGGDEFVLIVEGLHDPVEGIPIGCKMMLSLLDSVELRCGDVVNTGASIGLALYPDDGDDMGDMMVAAHDAVYQGRASSQMKLHSACARQKHGDDNRRT